MAFLFGKETWELESYCKKCCLDFYQGHDVPAYPVWHLYPHTGIREVGHRALAGPDAFLLCTDELMHVSWSRGASHLQQPETEPTK